MGKLLSSVGALIVAACIGMALLFIATLPGYYEVGMAFAASVSGLILLGLGEIVRLLDSNKDTTERMSTNVRHIAEILEKVTKPAKRESSHPPKTVSVLAGEKLAAERSSTQKKANENWMADLNKENRLKAEKRDR